MLFGFLLLLAACNSGETPSYQELQEQNEALEAQLASVNGKIQDSQSELDNLKSGIEELSNEPCHADSADDLNNDADSVGSALDDAEDESQ